MIDLSELFEVDSTLALNPRRTWDRHTALKGINAYVERTGRNAWPWLDELADLAKRLRVLRENPAARRAFENELRAKHATTIRRKREAKLAAWQAAFRETGGR